MAFFRAMAHDPEADQPRYTSEVAINPDQIAWVRPHKFGEQYSEVHTSDGATLVISTSLQQILSARL